MNDPSKAVFLSYASEDAAAALRICTALRAAGIEVWFDQSELRGGDAWDAAIRQQIKTCALFVAVISRNTHARDEGYFRLEWKIAVDRSHLMAMHKAFIVPVVIDDTRDNDHNVPDRFREVQWTRLPDGVTPQAFTERIARLLSPEALTAGAPSPVTGGPRPEPLRPVAAPGGRSKLLWGVLAAAILGAAGYFALVRPATHEPAPVPPPIPAVPASTVAGTAIPEKSIAVLPFVNLSSDKDQEYFSDGLSEELIDRLSKIPDLRVPARTSSFYFKGKSDDTATIAQKLHVANLLEGSVRKAGTHLRVTAELIRADNGYHLWSETYDRELKDVFKVQDEIAGAVVAALKLQLATAAPVGSQRTTNTEAYNAYLLGRQFANRRNIESWRRAIEAYRRAVALDPGYAAAYAGLATADSYLSDFNGDMAGRQRAMEFANKAVSLAPDQVDGYAARGYLEFTFTWDWTAAQADLAKALAIDPTDSAAQRRYSQLLALLGDMPAALVAAKKATTLDPLSEPAWQTLAMNLSGQGDFGAARAAVARALEIAPESELSLNTLAQLQLLQGQAAQALETSLRSADETFRAAGIAMAQYTLGRPAESQQALDGLIAKHANDSAYQIAEVYAWRKENDKAFEWLGRAVDEHDGGLSTATYDAILAPLFGDPRFSALKTRLKLPH
jgi:TolB-like protein